MNWLRAGTIAVGLVALFAGAVGATAALAQTSTDASENSGASRRVHVIFVESPMDVARLGELEEVCGIVRCRGGASVCYYDSLRHGDSRWLVSRVRRIRCAEPDAAIMLVGWSSGCRLTLEALSMLRQQGLSVDTLVHLDSSLLNFTNGCRRPANVNRVVLIYRTINRPDNIPYDALYLVDERWHLRVPKRRRTLGALTTEIRRLRKAGVSEQTAAR